MSKIVFETATIADSVKKASRIAPSKGSAFDKAAGVVLQFDPSQPVKMAVLRATNLELFSIEWVNVVEWEGESTIWRLPSDLLAQVLGSLPIGTDNTVTLESFESGYSFHVLMKSGRTKAKFYPLDAEHYPIWSVFNPDKMFPATDLGGRIDQVEWATDKAVPRYAGVYLDGQYAIATDSYRLARVPLSIPDLQQPIVIPASVLTQALKQTGEISIGVEDNLLQIMPNEYTQIKTVIYNVEYPNVSKVMEREMPNSLTINRDALIAVMERANAFSVGDRTAFFRCFIGNGEFQVVMDNEEMGTIGDSLEIPDYADHEPFEVRFTPKNILEPLQKAPNNEVTLMYQAGNVKTLIHIDGGSGYNAWVMPRVQIQGESSDNSK